MNLGLYLLQLLMHWGMFVFGGYVLSGVVVKVCPCLREVDSGVCVMVWSVFVWSCRSLLVLGLEVYHNAVLEPLGFVVRFVVDRTSVGWIPWYITAFQRLYLRVFPCSCR